MAMPAAQGLYDPNNEHDACGVGFVAHIKGAKSHAIVRQGLQILINLDHRGAVGADVAHRIDGARACAADQDGLAHDLVAFQAGRSDVAGQGDEVPGVGDESLAEGLGARL